MWTGTNVLLRCRNCSEAFPVWTEALSVMQFATLPFHVKRSFTKTRFRCNFCSKKVFILDSDRSKPIRYGTFHFQQRSGAVLSRSRNCFESSIPSVNRSRAPFHYPETLESYLKSVQWTLAEFSHNRIVQSPQENYFNVCRQHKEMWDLVNMTIIQTRQSNMGCEKTYHISCLTCCK